MKTSEAKPCPFCGSSDIEIEQTNPEAIWFRCNDCGAETESESHIDDALRNWNMRTEADDA